MLDVDHGAVQAQAHERSIVVEPALVRAGGDYVLHALAGYNTGNQRAHQQSCDRRVAVGEMKDVRLFLLPGPEAEALKAGVSEGLVVVDVVIAGDRGDGIDAHSPKIVRESLKERQGVGR